MHTPASSLSRGCASVGPPRSRPAPWRRDGRRGVPPLMPRSLPAHPPHRPHRLRRGRRGQTAGVRRHRRRGRPRVGPPTKNHARLRVPRVSHVSTPPHTKQQNPSHRTARKRGERGERGGRGWGWVRTFPTGASGGELQPPGAHARSVGRYGGVLRRRGRRESTAAARTMRGGADWHGGRSVRSQTHRLCIPRGAGGRVPSACGACG